MQKAGIAMACSAERPSVCPSHGYPVLKFKANTHCKIAKDWLSFVLPLL